MKKAVISILTALRLPVRLIAKARFWQVALLDLGLRLFVVRPLGALLGIIVGLVWAFHNMDIIELLLMKLHLRYIAWSSKSETQCPWFESKGRAEILELADRLSSQGISYCNLADELMLPDKSQWCVLSKHLNELGFLTQTTGDAFFITWRQNRAAQNTPEAA